MSRLVRITHRKIRSYYSSILPVYGPRNSHCPPLLPRNSISSTFLFQTRQFASDAYSKSPFEANILRILRTEIQYQSDYAPPLQPVTKFHSFTVQDRPGEQWITMKGKYGDGEYIKIEATMFDGCETVPKLGDDGSAEEELRLHISVLVDISKADGSNDLEFLCSAWPNSLDIQRVYVLQRDKMLARPYMGPDFGNLNSEMQKMFRNFLAARGVDDELSIFLHEFMMNKDQSELIRWLGNVKSFMEL